MRLAKLTLDSGKVTHVLPDAVEDYIRYRYRPASIEEVEACGYGIGAGWHPTRCGNPDPCPEHGHLRCGCGRRAVGACGCAGSLGVCGNPVCEEPGWCMWHKPHDRVEAP